MFWTNTLTNLCITAVMVILLYFKNYFKAVYLAFKIPGPPALPLVGNALLIKDTQNIAAILTYIAWSRTYLLYNTGLYEMVTLATNISETYSPIMRIWISILPFFLVFEPKHLQIILGSSRYSTKSIFYSLVHNLIGDGLITHTGEKWKRHRKLIQPCFHINMLKMYFDTFYKSSTVMVQSLQGETDVNITRFANRFVSNVLQATVLGVSVQNDAESSPYRKATFVMPHRITRPWLLLDTIFKRTDISKKESEHKDVLKNYTRKILENKKKHILLNDPFSTNLMEMMMDISKNNPDFTEADVISESCTFMLAGQDSAGAALAFSLYFLAAHQDVQNKVLEELKTIFGDTSRTITFEDLGEMKYLEQCIKETLRLCPTVPMISRKLTEDVSFGKHLLPTGASILIAPFATHRLPHVFPDPLKFDPNRFSPENKAKIHPYAYIPFSMGPRNCIGYKFAMIELKTVISQILINYHLSLTPGHEKLNLSYKISLKTKNGIWLRLSKRCDN